MDEDVDSFFVIEEMKDSWKHAPEKGKLLGPIDSHRVPYIAKVHVICFSSKGVYICKDFGTFPHYMIDRDKFKSQVLDKCNHWTIPTKVYSSKKQLSRSSIMCVWQLGDDVPTSDGDKNDTGSQSEVPLLDEESVSKILVELANLDFDSAEVDSVNNKLRGAQQRHFGYTPNHSLKRVNEEGQASMQPQLIGGEVPPEWESRFVALTRIGSILFEHPTSRCIRDPSNTGELFGDDDRNKRFANTINPNNRVEALTFSVTSSPGNLLKIHVDVSNRRGAGGLTTNIYSAVGKLLKRRKNERRNARHFLRTRAVAYLTSF